MPRLHAITHFVDNVEAATAHWQAALGVQPIKSSPEFASFQTGECEINLHPADAKSPAGSSVAYWEITSIERTRQLLELRNFRVHRGPLELNEGSIMQLRDSTGETIGLFERATPSLKTNSE